LQKKLFNADVQRAIKLLKSQNKGGVIVDVVQGDNSINYPFIIPKDIDLTDATVNVKIKKPTGGIVIKVATITNSAKGECYFTLLSDDVPESGNYFYQWTVENATNGVKKSGRPIDFYVYVELKEDETPVLTAVAGTATVGTAIVG
jgi:hypothetical protein